jgi:L-aminoadipate-semialdehyde dehydrogenase
LDAAQDEIPFDTLLHAFNAEPPKEALFPHNNEDSGFRQSLFRVRFFNMTDTTPDTLSSSKTSSGSDLTIFISQSPSLRRLLPIQIKLVYNTVLFAESRMKIMLQQLESLLQSAGDASNQEIGKIPLLGDSQAQSLLPDPSADLNW